MPYQKYCWNDSVAWYVIKIHILKKHTLKLNKLYKNKDIKFFLFEFMNELDYDSFF